MKKLQNIIEKGIKWLVKNWIYALLFATLTTGGIYFTNKKIETAKRKADLELLMFRVDVGGLEAKADMYYNEMVDNWNDSVRYESNREMYKACNKSLIEMYNERPELWQCEKRYSKDTIINGKMETVFIDSTVELLHEYDTCPPTWQEYREEMDRLMQKADAKWDSINSIDRRRMF